MPAVVPNPTRSQAAHHLDLVVLDISDVRGERDGLVVVGEFGREESLRHHDGHHVVGNHVGEKTIGNIGAVSRLA
jgi:hypothetical protein